MTQPATHANGGISAHSNALTASSMPSSGSPGTNPNPILNVSGGSWGGGTADGNDANGNPDSYNDPQPVPIGAMITVTASLGGPPVQATWDGGTMYSSYPLGAANTNAPSSLKPTLNPKPYPAGALYSFIADATPRTYFITATVPGGESTISFTTYGPTGTLKQTNNNSYPFFNPNGTDPSNGQASALVIYTYPQGTTQASSAGMYIQAHVTPSMKVGGTLMFLQTMSTQRFLKGTFGTNTTGAWSGNNQVAVDDGGTEPPNNANNNPGQIGYPTTASNFTQNNGGPSYVTSWTCPVNGPVPDQFMFDTPYMGCPIANSPNLLQIGTTDQNNNPLPEKFSTYLMFQGQNAVWVPIAQINWSWSITVQGNGNGGWGQPSNQTSPPASSPTGGSPAFGPGWTTSYSFSQFNYQ